MRRVLKRREIVADDWRHLEEDPGAASGTHSVIVPWKELRANFETWSARQGRLGVRISPTDKIEDMTAELERCALVAVEFPTLPKVAATRRAACCARAAVTRVNCAPSAPRSNAISSLRWRAVALMLFEVAAGEDLEACAQALERYTVAYQAGARAL